jgi:hypothetical protein
MIDEERLRRSLEQVAEDVGSGDPDATWARATRRAHQLRRRRRAASVAAGVLVLGLVAGAVLPQVLGSRPPEESDVAVEDGPEAVDEAELAREGSEPAEPGRPVTRTCTDADGAFAVSYPEGWYAGEGGCRRFASEPLGEPEGIGGGPLPGVRISADVHEVEFDTYVERVAEGHGTKEVVERDERTVDGRRALRWEVLTSSEGAYPEGTRLTGWVVELTEWRVLVLRTNDAGGDEPYEESVEVLDAMAATARPLERD